MCILCGNGALAVGLDSAVIKDIVISAVDLDQTVACRRDALFVYVVELAVVFEDLRTGESGRLAVGAAVVPDQVACIGLVVANDAGGSVAALVKEVGRAFDLLLQISNVSGVKLVVGRTVPISVLADGVFPFALEHLAVLKGQGNSCFVGNGAVGALEGVGYEVIPVAVYLKPAGGQLAELGVVVYAVLGDKTGVGAVLNALYIVHINAVDLLVAVELLAVYIENAVNYALCELAVHIALAVNDLVAELTAGCAAKDLLLFGHLKGKLSLTIVVFADVGHRGAGPCNSAVGAFKPAIYGGICKVAGIGKGDGVGRAVGIKGFVLVDIIPIADSAVELKVLGLFAAVVADDEIGLLRGNEAIGVTGCGDNSTPVDNRMTNLAICPAGQTILDAGGSNVRNCDSINMVGGVRTIILSGLGTVVVTAVPVLVIGIGSLGVIVVPVDRLGVNLNAFTGEDFISAVSKGNLSCSYLDADVNRPYLVACLVLVVHPDNTRVTIVSSYRSKLPCSDRDRYKCLLARDIDVAGSGDGNTRDLLVFVDHLIGSIKAVGCLHMVKLPAGEVVEIEINGNGVNRFSVRGNNVYVVEGA